MLLKAKDGLQDRFPLLENVFLIHAESPKAAWDKAWLRASEDQDYGSGTLTFDDKPAMWIVLGIRKVVECDIPEERPDHGREVTYTTLTAASEEDAKRFAKGDPVTIHLED